MSSPGKKTTVILGASAALAIVCLPFAVHLLPGGGGIVGSTAELPAVEGDSDVYDEVWHFWWTGYALGRGEDPRYTDMIRYPGGSTLAYHNVGWPDVLLFSLLGTAWGDPVLSYDLSLLLGTLAVLAAGVLTTREFGIRGIWTLLAGVACALLPSRIAHLEQHYQLAATGFMIGYLGAVRAWLARRSRPALALSFLLALAAGLESAYFTVFCAAGLAAVYLLSREEGRLTPGRSGPVAAVLVLAAAAGGTAAFFITSPGAGAGSPVVPWRDAVFWAAEPQSWILPSPYGVPALLLGMPAKMSWMSNSFEGVVTPGLVILALFVYGVVRGRRWVLGAVVLVLSLLTLGPELRVFGRPLGVPLPFRLVQLLPFMGGIKSPSRFALLAGPLMAFAAVITLAGIRRRWPRILLTAAVLLELAVPVLPSVSAFVPGEYESLRGGEGPVLEVPCSPGIRRYSLFQTVDERPRPVGFLVRSGGTAVPARLAPFSLDWSGPPPDAAQALGTGAAAIVYNRWMLPDSLRSRFDALYAGLFGGFGDGDSVAVWTPDGP